MNLIKFVSIILLGLLLAGCQHTKARFSLEMVPQEYRSCAAKVLPQLPNRAVTQKEVLIAYAELKKYAGTKDRCLKGLIKWNDAQYQAYSRSF